MIALRGSRPSQAEASESAGKSQRQGSRSGPAAASGGEWSAHIIMGRRKRLGMLQAGEKERSIVFGKRK